MEAASKKKAAFFGLFSCFRYWISHTHTGNQRDETPTNTLRSLRHTTTAPSGLSTSGQWLQRCRHEQFFTASFSFLSSQLLYYQSEWPDYDDLHSIKSDPQSNYLHAF